MIEEECCVFIYECLKKGKRKLQRNSVFKEYRESKRVSAYSYPTHACQSLSPMTILILRPSWKTYPEKIL